MVSIESDQSTMSDELDIRWCKPCIVSKRESKATMYCKEFDNYLCEECYGYQKQTMNKLHDTVDVMEKLKIAIIYCDPCKEGKIDKTAQLFCPICDEYLCDACVETHKMMKSTKTHVPIAKELVEDQTKMSDEILIECEPCKLGNKRQNAKKFCHECNEYLCTSCVILHQRAKLTKSHLPIAIELVEEQSKLSDEILIECEPCRLGNERQRAKKFCHECNEYLCASCAILHQRTKMTKRHAPESIENLQKRSSLRKHFCHPCSDETQEEAAMFCETCEEYLCEHCVAYHKKQKATKEHILTSDLGIGDTDRDKDIPCEICMLTETYSLSENFCVECEEHLCKQCTEVHLKRKTTKNHQISKNNKEIKLYNVVDCTVCQDAGCMSKAVKYCRDCIEYMCEKCMAMHQRNKLMKVHNLIPSEEMTETACETCEKCDAVAYCIKCNEMLCWQCRSKHNNTKKYNDHELAPVNIDYCDETSLYCKPCEERDIQELACAFCLDCDRELFCSECAKKHRARMKTQSHYVVMDIAKFEEEEKKDDAQSHKNKSKSIHRRVQASPKENDEFTRPGKPVSTETGSDFIVLSWDTPSNFQDGNYYQVSIKDVDQNSKWKLYHKDFTTAIGKIEYITSNTRFVFRVRVIQENGEGLYSPESDVIITFPSPASGLVNISTKVDGENPTIYALPVTENRKARDETAKLRQFWLGSPSLVETKERTIMFFGASGTGKSTMVNGFVNYILGVNWDDPFRFTIIDFEEEEKQRETNQALSQSEWITRYTIFPEKGSRVSYCLNIIDTPGFDDRRGLYRDQEIVEQIRQLFSAKQPKGVCVIDAICFLMKAPDARFTAVQSYTFQSMMSLFANDIEGNICSLITFADGIDPPCLAALKESHLPFGEYFTFNNSGLFAPNVGPISLAPMFWDMGIKSFQHFFSHLEQGKPKSLQLTTDVLDGRIRFEHTVKNLQPQLDAVILKINQMNQEIAIIDRNKSTLKDNADFICAFKQTQQKRRELPPGQLATNCTHCHFTCNKNCDLQDDVRKSCRKTMDGNGFCTVCPAKCKWDKHAKLPYIIDNVTVTVQKPYRDMQKKYQEAAGNLPTQEQIVEEKTEKLNHMIDDAEFLKTSVKECYERLNAIALRPNPLFMTEHIDLLIENETLMKKDGFSERINTLNEFRKKAMIMSDATKYTKVAQTAMRNAEVKKNRSLFK